MGRGTARIHRGRAGTLVVPMILAATLGAAPPRKTPEPAPPASVAGKGASGGSSDLAAARRLFEANLDAIRRKDRDAYLACYLKSAGLVRTGPEGMTLGYEDFVKQAGEWPDLFEAQDLQVVAVRPGLVYGTYRYRVRYGVQEHQGVSERYFVSTADGWRIAVTTAFEAPPGTRLRRHRGASLRRVPWAEAAEARRYRTPSSS